MCACNPRPGDRRIPVRKLVDKNLLFLATDLALYKRLVGYPLDDKGRPQLDAKGVPVNREVIGPPGMNGYDRLWDPINKVFIAAPPLLPSYGIRLPLAKGPFKAQRGLTSRDPDALRAGSNVPSLDPNVVIAPVNAKVQPTLPSPWDLGFESQSFRQVPVFDENITGRKYDDVYPCVTFRWSDTEYEPRTFIYHDPLATPDLGSPPVNILNRNAQTVESGNANRLVRPHPESWNPIYTITAWAKNEMELAIIAHQIMYLFPGKGAVTIQFQDGSTHTCDMLLQRMQTIDEGNDEVLQTQGSDEQRAFGRQFIYLIEGYLDNTTNAFGVQDVRSVPVVLQRLFEIDDIVNGAIVMPQTDLNLQELSPIQPQGGL